MFLSTCELYKMTAIPLDPLIHYYATRAEIADWLCAWVLRFDLHCVIGSHPPTVIVTDVPWGNPAGVLAVLKKESQVFMSVTPIDTAVEHVSRLWNVNSGLLCITLPRYSKKGMRYGLFGTGTKDKRSLKTWQKVAEDFFRLTSAGLWGVFPSNKRKKFNPEKRYSPGAAKLWHAGHHLLGAGDDTWHIQEPSDPADG
jgi:hypothetical protein